MRHNQIKQKGSLLVISVVVMVVVGYLSLNLIKIETNNHATTSSQVLGTQAWFLAHSGIEWGLVQLFPLGQTTADTSICDGNIIRPETVKITGSGCRTAPQVRCIKTQVNYQGHNIQYFHISSLARCGSGINTVTRVQEVWAKESN